MYKIFNIDLYYFLLKNIILKHKRLFGYLSHDMLFCNSIAVKSAVALIIINQTTKWVNLTYSCVETKTCRQVLYKLNISVVFRSE